MSQEYADRVSEAYRKGRDDFHLANCHLKSIKCPFSDPHLASAWREGLHAAIFDMNDRLYEMTEEELGNGPKA